MSFTSVMELLSGEIMPPHLSFITTLMSYALAFTLILVVFRFILNPFRR